MKAKKITLEALQASHDYWVANFEEKQKSIDKFMVKTANRLGQIDYKLKKRAAFTSHEARTRLYEERDVLEGNLIHFHGFIDVDFLISHDLAPESIARAKYRRDRIY